MRAFVEGSVLAGLATWVCLLVAAALLTGCSAVDKLVPTCEDEGVEECSAVRCTDYTAQVTGYFTASSGAVQGRQVTFYGPIPEGTVVEPADCKVTVGERGN